MGSSASKDINTDLKDIEVLARKPASDLSELENEKLKAFQTTYSPCLNELNSHVLQVSQILGKPEENSIDAMLSAISSMKKVIHNSKKVLEDEERKKMSYHNQAIDCRRNKDDAGCRHFLTQEKKCKDTISKVVGRIEAVEEKLHDVKESDMTVQFSKSMKAVSVAMDAVVKEIGGPDRLTEIEDKMDELNSYLAEIDVTLKDSVEVDDLDEIMGEIDGELEADAKKAMSLPTVPVYVPKVVSKTEESVIVPKAVEID